MQQWEYKVVTLNENGRNVPDAQQEDLINRLAAQGWELVEAATICYQYGLIGYILYFRRPKS
jgi:hypothetical protein